MASPSRHESNPLRNRWARQQATSGLKELIKAKIARSSSLLLPPFPEHGPLPPLKRDRGRDDASSGKLPAPKVAIVGAGASGLFTAMVLDHLNNNDSLKKKKFKVEYDIFEAAEKGRVGGRLFTYNFAATGACNPQGRHDYFDVGAMRFPETPVMTRLFDLFEKLDMKKAELPDNPQTPDDPPKGSLVPYYFHGDVEPWCYNNKTIWAASYEKAVEADQNEDPFSLNHDQKIAEKIIKQPPDDTFNSTVKQLREYLREDEKSSPPGTKAVKLLCEYDKYSTRQFLADKKSFNYETIEFLETFNGGTNWYDQAHSENVLESIDFEFCDRVRNSSDATQVPWWNILGGAQQLALKMEASLAKKPLYSARVSAIRVPTDKKDVDIEIDVQLPKCSGGKETSTFSYNGIFNSTTLSCLKRIDTSGTSLDYPTVQGMRSLGYGSSAKVGMKFKRAWWIHDLPHKIKKGGQGQSDLSIRTCVYPSFNIHDPSDEPAVLLCSYTWQQDANRIGALVSSSRDHSQQLKEEADLKELVLRDLARLHGSKEMSEEKVYKLISDLYLDHYAHDWDHDPNTGGAFAFFRPQQFTRVWGKMIHPRGNLVIIGEHASPHHAWVVGALESAVYGVCLWLKTRILDIAGAEDAIKVLETEDPGNPFVGLPPYMDPDITDWSGFLGAIENEEQRAKRRGGGLKDTTVEPPPTRFEGDRTGGGYRPALR